jgi:hypothetical protein
VVQVHELGAVRAHEAELAQALLEGGEALVEDELGATHLDHRVAIRGADARHFARIHDAQRAARARRQGSRIGRPHQPFEELAHLRIAGGSRGLAHAFEGALQPFGLHGLHEIVHRRHLERAERVLVVRGREHDGRQALGAGGHLDPVEAGHAHVEEHHVRRELRDPRQRVHAVHGLAAHLDARDALQHSPQATPGGRLVVHHEDPHAPSGGSTGIETRTRQPPSGLAPCSRVASPA